MSGYAAPRFWPVWLSLALLWLAAHLPWRWQMALGDGVGRLAWHLVPRRRRITQTNLAHCFPELSEAEHDALARHHFRHNGRALFEGALAFFAPVHRLQALITRIDGLEQIEQARTAGKGVVLLGGHFTSMILCGRLLALHLPLQIVYKEASNPLSERMARHYRAQHYEGLIENTDFRSLVRRLKENRVVWYAPDQDFGRHHGVFAPFFGVATITLTHTARLARLTGAAVVPISYGLDAAGGGYRLTLHPPLDDFPSGDEVADATRYNRLLEAFVRERPAEYLWVHRRFKTRPPGEPPFY